MADRSIPARGQHTGRAAKIRALLDANPGQSFSAGDVAARIGERHASNCVSASLGGLVTQGKIARIKRGHYSHYTSLKPGQRPAAAALQPARRDRLNEPVCSITGIPRANEIARERIAADTDAFLASGGKIERLGPTQFFQPLEPAANEEYQRARDRALVATKKRYQD